MNYSPIDHLFSQNQKNFTPVSRGLVGKEAEPLRVAESGKDGFEIHEMVEHEPEAEVVPFVTPRKETVELDTDLDAMGISSTANPAFTSQKTIKLPLEDEKIVSGLRAPTSSGLRWLSEWCMYFLKMAHLTLKKVHGHVVRVAV